jgi:hypothetical protein
MLKNFFLLSMIFLMLGCAGSRRGTGSTASRYDAIVKQNEYVSMSFTMDEKEFAGKTKSDIRAKLGEPATVLDRVINGAPREMWIYYPKGTNNFIAITITFDGDIVLEATYESVM